MKIYLPFISLKRFFSGFTLLCSSVVSAEHETESRSWKLFV